MGLKEENLRLKMALALMIQQFYDWRIKPEEAKDYNIEYDEDDEYVECYFHMFESAGEHAWDVLGLDKPIVGEKEMWNLTDNAVVLTQNTFSLLPYGKYILIL